MLLVRDAADPHRFTARSNTPWTRVAAAVFAQSLDRQLVSGRHPEAGRLLAARANRWVAPAVRRRLARRWLDLVERARHNRGPGRARVPLCRQRILSAEAQVRDMAGLLAATLPVPARGVAMAGLVLDDGGGPLYDPRCGTDLRALLVEITAQLDPARWSG